MGGIKQKGASRQNLSYVSRTKLNFPDPFEDGAVLNFHDFVDF